MTGVIEGNHIRGMKVDNEGKATNKGLISLKGLKNTIGMSATNKSEIINETTGIIQGYISGMAIDDSSFAINRGNILLNNIENKFSIIGMESFGGCITNDKSITINGNYNIGMYASGSQTKITNNVKGTIYLRGASLDGNGDIDAIADFTQDASGVNEFGKDNYGNIAMKIENGATMVNKGKIIFGRK